MTTLDPGLATVPAPRSDADAATPVATRPTTPPAPGRAHRLVTLVAAVGLFGVCFATWSTTVQVPATGAVAVVGFAGGLLAAVAALAARTERGLRRVDLGVLLLAMVVLAGWATSTLYFQPGYGTDEAAFEQYAAQLLLHGHDPYGANLLAALDQFRVPIQYATYTMSGHVVAGLSYPALPVLLVAPFIPLTHGVQAVIVANVVALLAGLVLGYRLLPAPWRALAPLVVVGLPILFGYAVSGVNAIMLMTALLVVAHRWAATGRGGTLGRGGVVRAVALGLALSTQQLGWFVAPFVLVGLLSLRVGELGTRRGVAVVARYTAVTVGVFAAVNLPFVLWNPAAWLAGVAAPLTQHAIPYGQGLVDATLFFHVGGGAVRDYTLAAAVAYLTLLWAFAANPRRLGPACFVLPVSALWLPTRSLAEYFMTLIAVWVVAAATVSHREFTTAAAWRPQWLGRLPRRLLGGRPTAAVLPAVGLLPVVGLLAGALATPQPLGLHIVGMRTNGQLQSVWLLDVRVANHSGHRLAPHFATNDMGQASTFWNVLAGPASLGPHRSATYRIEAPNRGSMPGLTSPFLLQAVTDAPQTISSTGLVTPQPFDAAISPSFVDALLRPGQPVVLRVQLRSPFGGLVRRAGVRVAVGQLIYAQDALVPAEASINRKLPGQTPVFARTAADGVATFRVTDRSPQGQPVYFQAWVQPSGGYPYGYSEILPVFWAGATGR